MTRRTCIVLLILLSSVSPAAAEVLPWRKAADMGPQTRVHEPGTLADGPVVEVRGVNGGSVTTVLAVDQPRVPSHEYQLRGRIKYEDVHGIAFIEMWSAFPDGGQYFSRTLAASGPMSNVTGSSEWRDVVLPFFSKPGVLPNKIWVNVVLPGQGKVYLTPFELSAAGEGQTGDWWTERQGGMIGGIGGGTLGLVGALIGTLAGLGRARRLVLAACWTCIIAGAVSLTTGIVAVILGQPYHVWYPPLLAGIIATVVCGSLLPVIYRRYGDHEMRRMSAMDVP